MRKPLTLLSTYCRVQGKWFTYDFFFHHRHLDSPPPHFSCRSCLHRLSLEAGNRESQRVGIRTLESWLQRPIPVSIKVYRPLLLQCLLSSSQHFDLLMLHSWFYILQGWIAFLPKRMLKELHQLKLVLAGACSLVRPWILKLPRESRRLNFPYLKACYQVAQLQHFLG